LNQFKLTKKYSLDYGISMFRYWMLIFKAVSEWRCLFY
jgi:hypothetical protein